MAPRGSYPRRGGNVPPVAPLRLEAEGAQLRALGWPDGGAGGELTGEIEIAGEVRADSPRPLLVLHLQACDDRRCLPAIALEIPVA